MDNKKVAVMQPYIFPYLGYFQLVQAVDVFIFYDDVNFIKRGWINRNNILLKNQRKLISFPCMGASSFKEIRDVGVDSNGKEFRKIQQTIELAYRKAPYFKEVFPIVEEILTGTHKNVSEFAARSIVLVSEYLDLKKDFKYSSETHFDSKGMKREERLMAICEKEAIAHYVNAIGGRELYDKKDFAEKGIKLDFLKPSLPPYKQFNDKFVEGLSIIDVLMFNDKTVVNHLLSGYSLV